ncbi:MAG: hypothetical protein KatS3mg132_788 [Limisphaera sp.]|nr:MAG: hypothetical protein KatS3mg132_788 [Limisphaera sp.]
MILLGSDYLVFELATGERVPCSAASIVGELMADGSPAGDAEMLEETVRAVFHYFRHDLAREAVTLEEFTRTLEQALRALAQEVRSSGPRTGLERARWEDLLTLAHAAGDGELFFFAELRRAVQTQLRLSPAQVRFCGLRACVKRLMGVRRWCPRCEALRERILEYLRACVRAHASGECLLVVE